MWVGFLPRSVKILKHSARFSLQVIDGLKVISPFSCLALSFLSFWVLVRDNLSGVGIGVGVGVGNLGQNKRTIEQEYQAYVMPPFLVQSSNPLKFWEVGGSINSGCTLLTRCARSTNSHFQHCFRWRWIISWSKWPLCPVNEYFPWVAKQIQSGGIALILLPWKPCRS